MSRLVTVKCDRCGEILEGDKAEGSAVCRLTNDKVVYAADLCSGCVGYLKSHIEFLMQKRRGAKPKTASAR